MIGYSGGVTLMSDPPEIMIGEPSKGMKITRVNLLSRTYTVDFDYMAGSPSSLELRTAWPIKDAQGATFKAVSPDVYRFTLNSSTQNNTVRGYQQGKVVVTFGASK